MKASRLLELLLLLQTHQRMTTAELADRLEVSRRTILRDVEALSGAGVPVYAERGRRGAIVLMTQARVNAAHLDPEEVELLLLTGLDERAIAALGLGAAARSATRKLATRAAPSDATRRLSDVIVVDNTAWGGHDPARDDARHHGQGGADAQDRGADLAALLQLLQQDQRLRIRYRRSGEAAPRDVVVDPYGLADKAGRWYLVADVDATPRLFALTRLSGYEGLAVPSRRRPGQDLASVWEGLRAATEPAGSYVVRARLRRDRLDLARRILGARLVGVHEPDDAAGRPGVAGAGTGEQDTDEHDTVEITVRYEHPEGVRQLLQFADHIDVLSPPEARRRIHELAAHIARTHADPRDGRTPV